ncbi:hypothetical protein N7510_000669 [Penicillium lagena]|uniref:uncharacterized protein n=1 Tax=Penicillium lagena TaxID=94218 RepID=UPI002540BB54|nr:uncharacterized protein N7510_000669 [Penicillium lagena]KAJ5624360.1 hypothetical protein N7510_000669 [Penicillium lagena]
MFSFFGWGSRPQPDPSTSQEKTTSPDRNNEPTTSPSSASIPSQSQSSSQLAQQTRPPGLAPNVKLLFGGIAFFTLSVLITRRSTLKKRIACIPPFYTSSLYHQPQANGAMEALEALNLATINVLSFGMLASGAVAYAFDINGLEDMRRVVRSGLEEGGPGAGKTDEEMEKEVTQWVVSVLGDRFETQLEKEKEKTRRLEGEKK